MAVDIDTSKALRGVADLQRLVAAVVGADEHDEPDWLEWKSTLDLSAKEGCFPVARAILGMANRIPDRAALTCEGLGYVVVGAEPGSCPGIATVDPATLTQLIEPYLGGADGPAWTPTYVPADRVTVLVVTVEAPRQGDPIFTVRREFDRARTWGGLRPETRPHGAGRRQRHRRPPGPARGRPALDGPGGGSHGGRAPLVDRRDDRQHVHQCRCRWPASARRIPA